MQGWSRATGDFAPDTAATIRTRRTRKAALIKMNFGTPRRRRAERTRGARPGRSRPRASRHRRRGPAIRRDRECTAPRREHAVRRCAAEKNRSVELHVPLATESSVTDSHLHLPGRQALSSDGLEKRCPGGPKGRRERQVGGVLPSPGTGRASRALQGATSGAEAAMRSRSWATFTAQHHDLQGHGSAAVSQVACCIAATGRQRTQGSAERRRGQRRLPLTPCMTGGEPGTRTPDQRIMIPLL
jgi:hypothetical protein